MIENYFLLALWIVGVLGVLFVLELIAQGIQRYRQWRYERGLHYLGPRRYRY